MAITVYGDRRSGNCHKVAVVCRVLAVQHDWVEVDILNGESRTDRFLAHNPAGQVPMIVLADGRSLAQSNAILLFLAEGSALIPKDAFQRAQMMQWLFWEQYSHEPFVATARFQKLYLGQDPDPGRMQRGAAALALMNAELSQRPFFVGGALSLADISLAAYTRLAGDAGFDLAEHPAVLAWLERVQAAGGLFHD
ncbi:MAG: glutathione S-transferase family protein [Rhodothalassiaceae bacterium]